MEGREGEEKKEIEIEIERGPRLIIKSNAVVVAPWRTDGGYSEWFGAGETDSSAEMSATV